VVAIVALALAVAVLSAVEHAELIAHRVGEPFGSLVLAVAVTIIEVALILTLMVAGVVLPERDVPGRDSDAGRPEAEVEEHADPPSNRAALVSLGLLLAALVGVVGLAKVESKPIEEGVFALGLPAFFVGVLIALLVLLPETLAAARAARRNRIQISINLALGSAMASIGLTIPAIAVASIWLTGPLILGLGPTQIVLLAITVVSGVLTVVPGRATRLQGAVHLVLLAAFLFLAANP
jgi:Ca2+:H+ antiporter